MTGFDVGFLGKLFKFKQVRIGEPLKLGCASIEFFYSLHTIPCIGFRARWNTMSLAYSADTNYCPELIDRLHVDKVIGAERRDQLMNFPWGKQAL